MNSTDSSTLNWTGIGKGNGGSSANFIQTSASRTALHAREKRESSGRCGSSGEHYQQDKKESACAIGAIPTRIGNPPAARRNRGREAHRIQPTGMR